MRGRRSSLLVLLASLALFLGLSGSPSARTGHHHKDQGDGGDATEQTPPTGTETTPETQPPEGTGDQGANDGSGDSGDTSGDQSGDTPPDCAADGQKADGETNAAEGQAQAADSGRRHGGRDQDVVPGRYIVVYKQSVDQPHRKTDELQRDCNIDVKYRYSRAIKGFSAKLSNQQAKDLEQEPDVAAVVPDRVVHATSMVSMASGDSAPTGILRIGAATSISAHEASNVNVAVIDTGVDLGHPDLNVASGKNCMGSGPPADDNDHGTHVAGTIGARNNGSGVVGVAPGTKIYAVKVLDSHGSGYDSDIICGIDWVTSTRTDGDSSNDIYVANMSLGGVGEPVKSCSQTTDPLHKAICNSTAAGVTYVVAAGNDGWDFDYAASPDTPAAYPQVLTVTAMGDSDGRGGATGGSACGESDDRYASFSSYALTAAGQAHTMAAPGVCIKSTVPGGYQSGWSGTSMATPHVTGSVALCLGEGSQNGPCKGMTPAQIITYMRSQAAAARTATFGFTGDPAAPIGSQYFGYLVAPAAGATSSAPSVTAVSPAENATGVPTNTTVSVTFSEAMDTASAQGAFSLVRTSTGTAVGGTFSWSGNAMTFTPSAALAAGAGYTAKVTTAAKDSGGTPMAADKSWAFTTQSATVNAAPSAVTVSAGAVRSGGAANLAADDGSLLEVNSTTSGKKRKSDWYGRFSSVPTTIKTLGVSYSGSNSASCSQTVYIYNWSSAAWVSLDSRTVGTTETLITATPSGTLANYVSGTGEVRVRVACSKKKPSYISRGDLLRISYST